MAVLTPELIATGVILLALAILRIGFGRVFARTDWANIEDRRRWIVFVRNGSLGLGAFLIIGVWADELRVVGLSLAAVAVAVAITFQEPIKSVFGGLVRSVNGTYSLGDRIQVGSSRGVVVDYSLLTTTLIEVETGHFRTGRIISVPNSRFLTEPVVNETAGHEFVLHSFHVPVPTELWMHARDVLMAAAIDAAAPYIEPARTQMVARAKRHAIAVPTIEPLVTSRPTSVSEVDLTVRLPVASVDVWWVENQIVEAWLGRVNEIEAGSPPSAT